MVSVRRRRESDRTGPAEAYVIVFRIGRFLPVTDLTSRARGRIRPCMTNNQMREVTSQNPEKLRLLSLFSGY